MEQDDLDELRKLKVKELIRMDIHSFSSILLNTTCCQSTIATVLWITEVVPRIAESVSNAVGISGARLASYCTTYI